MLVGINFFLSCFFFLHTTIYPSGEMLKSLLANIAYMKFFRYGSQYVPRSIFYDLVVTRYFLVVMRCDLVVTRYHLVVTRNRLVVTRYDCISLLRDQICSYEIASRNYGISSVESIETI